MKLLTIFLSIIIITGCNQRTKEVSEKDIRIGIHVFTGRGSNHETVNWYYMRNKNETGEKGFYFESAKAVDNFTDANFIYYNARPDDLLEIYPAKEKIILIDPNNLPEHIQKNMAELESVTVRN